METGMDRLEIKLLGRIEVRYKDKYVGMSESKIKANKMWIMFEYILLNQERRVSSDELIDIIWPDTDVSNPSNSLKVLLFKLRREIESLGFARGKEVIRNIGGAYSFNSEIPHTIDVVEFVRYMDIAEEQEKGSEGQLKYILKALECYRGSVFHSVRHESWAASIQAIYSHLYTDAVNRAQTILQAQKKYKEIIKICQNALLMQPYTEDYYYHIISAYAAMENYSAASKMYNEVKSLIQKEYGTLPDSKFEKAYRELMKQRPKRNASVDELTEELTETISYPAAFHVEYGEFRQIYRFIARQRVRDDKKQKIPCLCQYTLGILKGHSIAKAEQEEHLEILQEALSFGLRQGDVFARTAPNQFAVIFNQISVENALSTAERIKRYFMRKRKNSSVGVLHNIAEIKCNVAKSRQIR